MSWTVEFNPALRIIEVTIPGATTGKDLRDITTKAIKRTQDHSSTSILIDASEIEVVASTFDIWNLPARQYEADNLDRRTRFALVLPRRDEQKEHAHFYETACRNRGWEVRSFPDREAAIKWLKKEDFWNKQVADDA